jgi:threonine/homoserine/homoserine lactone efflux protein
VAPASRADDDGPVVVHDDAPGAGSGLSAYRLLLLAVRTAWLSCACGVGAMTAGLVLRSPGLVGVFRLALGASFVVIGIALLLFLGVLASPARFAGVVPGSPPASVRRRAEALVAAVLVDLLDPDEPEP